MADDIDFTELLPLGDDHTPYRLVSTEGVSTFDTPHGTFLRVRPEAIREARQLTVRHSHAVDVGIAALEVGVVHIGHGDVDTIDRCGDTAVVRACRGHEADGECECEQTNREVLQHAAEAMARATEAIPGQVRSR